MLRMEIWPGKNLLRVSTVLQGEIEIHSVCARLSLRVWIRPVSLRTKGKKVELVGLMISGIPGVGLAHQ